MEEDKDIKILEEILKDIEADKNKACYVDRDSLIFPIIKNLIARHKELEENLNYRVRYCNILEKELYGENSFELTKLEDKYFIPKSKVQEKIEELENLKLCSDDFYKAITEKKIKLLEELLED